jgi:CelD/BcsL family acetyltransferase involved in cellulose biosynthesis
MAGPMQVELTDDPQAFRAGEWDALVETDPEGTFFHTPEFLKTWWEEFHPGGHLQLAFVSGDAGLVAACGFEVRDELLCFLGGFDVTDYMGPVAVAGTEDAVAKELVAAISGVDHWNRADLAGLPEDGRWLPALARAFEAAGMTVETGDDGVTPLLDLPATFEEYEATLHSKARHEMRRKRRRLERDAGEVRLVHTTRQNLDEHLDRFIAWHRGSGGPKGNFMVTGMEIFFRHLGHDFVEPGPFRLTFIEAGGVPMAGAISFRYKDAVYLYNSAFDHEHRALAPGMVLIAEMIREAIEAGVGRFDLLKGDLEYKYRFGPRPRAVKRLRVTR